MDINGCITTQYSNKFNSQKLDVLNHIINRLKSFLTLTTNTSIKVKFIKKLQEY
jgi:hypothetical protein